MIAAAFLVLLRPYSIQCALFLLLLLLGTIATILFFCCWHRRLQKGRHPIKSVFSGRSRSRGKRCCRSLRAAGAVPGPSPAFCRRRAAVARFSRAKALKKIQAEPRTAAASSPPIPQRNLGWRVRGWETPQPSPGCQRAVQLYAELLPYELNINTGRSCRLCLKGQSHPGVCAEGRVAG